MNSPQFWAVVGKLESAGLAKTAFDATSNTTGILLHPGVTLDTDALPNGVVVRKEWIEWGQQTSMGMLCHGPTDPREELAVVFATTDDEDLPDWNYVLIDEDLWDEDDDDDED